MTTATAPLPLVRSLLLAASLGLRRVAFTRKTVFMVLLLVVPCGLGLLVRSESPYRGMDVYSRALMPNLVMGLVQLMVLFYATGIVRDGMEDRTLAFLLTRPLRRDAVVFGLHLGMLTFILPLALLAAWGGFAACAIDRPADTWKGSVESSLALLTAVVIAATVFYAALYTLLGLVLRRPTIVALVYLVIGDGILATLRGPPRYLSFLAYFEALLAPRFDTRAAAPAFIAGGPDRTTAMIVLGVTWIVLLVLIQRVARKKDFIPYEKSPA